MSIPKHIIKLLKTKDPALYIFFSRPSGLNVGLYRTQSVSSKSSIGQNVSVESYAINFPAVLEYESIFLALHSLCWNQDKNLRQVLLLRISSSFISNDINKSLPADFLSSENYFSSIRTEKNPLRHFLLVTHLQTHILGLCIPSKCVCRTNPRSSPPWLLRRHGERGKVKSTDSYRYLTGKEYRQFHPLNSQASGMGSFFM